MLKPTNTINPTSEFGKDFEQLKPQKIPSYDKDLSNLLKTPLPDTVNPETKKIADEIYNILKDRERAFPDNTKVSNDIKEF